jgi:hypothetical protein
LKGGFEKKRGYSRVKLKKKQNKKNNIKHYSNE